MLQQVVVAFRKDGYVFPNIWKGLTEAANEEGWSVRKQERSFVRQSLLQ